MTSPQNPGDRRPAARPSPEEIERKPVAPEHENATRSLGRAVGEVVTGTAEPDLSEVDIERVPPEDDEDEPPRPRKP
jgi:hypothetical protein